MLVNLFQKRGIEQGIFGARISGAGAAPADGPGTVPATGYTIIEADSLDAATAACASAGLTRRVTMPKAWASAARRVAPVKVYSTQLKKPAIGLSALTLTRH